MQKPVIILGIESSCDETSAAVSTNDKILANIIATQKIHASYGGVVPELASRAHQQHIVPVVDQALKEANISKNEIDAVAFTGGPGLMGALLVGSSFAKSFALGLELPLIEVNHMHAHVLSHFAYREERPNQPPPFPFLCLTVSGGHTQIIVVKSHYDLNLIGHTLDDAAGEAFDKIAKVIGIPYPGGPVIDKYALKGNPGAYKFPIPNVPDLNFSFSGLKTAVLNFVGKKQVENPQFVEENMDDLCASVQHTIITILLQKLMLAVDSTQIRNVAIAGGVAANSGLRQALSEKKDLKVFIPPLEFCTDNAAMIAVAGYYKYLRNDFVDQTYTPFARFNGMK